LIIFSISENKGGDLMKKPGAAARAMIALFAIFLIAGVSELRCGPRDHIDHGRPCQDRDNDTFWYGCPDYTGLGAGVPDCDDNNDLVYPMAYELCDYVDNQCPGDAGYGFVDEGCAWQKLGTDVRITFDAASSLEPSLVFNQSGYGVSWHDNRDGNREIYFARLGVDGTKIGSEQRITESAGLSQDPSLAYTGSEYGLSWMDAGDIASLEIYFARIGPGGAQIGSNQRITVDSPANSLFPSLAFTGSEYGIAWIDERDTNKELYFARVSGEGVKIGADVRITEDPAETWNPSLVFIGSEYGVSWYDYRDGNYEIYFARIGASGAKIGSDVRITEDAGYSGLPSLAFTGSEYGVSWFDNRDGNEEIYFASMGDDGARLGPDTRITEAAGMSLYPSLVYTGSEYGVSWIDGRDGNYEIYFARIGWTR